MASEAALEKMRKVNLPRKVILESKISAKKEGAFSGKYYLIDFPFIEEEAVDYAHSSFAYLYKENRQWHGWKEMPCITSHEENRSFAYSEICDLVDPKKIILKEPYAYDVLNARYHGLFFSKALLELLQVQNCLSGLEIKDCTLLCAK